MKEFYSDKEMREIGYKLAKFLCSEMEIDGILAGESLIHCRVTMEKTTTNPNTQIEVCFGFQMKHSAAMKRIGGSCL
jgi:hypothetical protein